MARRLRHAKKQNAPFTNAKKKKRYRHLAVKIDPLSFFADSQPSSGRLMSSSVLVVMNRLRFYAIYGKTRDFQPEDEEKPLKHTLLI